MKKSTISLILPDINVWLAILLEDHVHRPAAVRWWEHDRSDVLGFIRFTQVGVLRLLTTPAAMNGKPLNMAEAWAAYDCLFTDERVAFVGESTGLEQLFREASQANQASPKLWADALLVAFAQQRSAEIVTFDQALASRYPKSILLK